MGNFETTSPEVVSTLLTIASYPSGAAVMTFNNQKYEVTVKRVTPPLTKEGKK